MTVMNYKSLCMSRNRKCSKKEIKKERERGEDHKGDLKGQCQEVVHLISAHVSLAKTEPHGNTLKVRCVPSMWKAWVLAEL